MSEPIEKVYDKYEHLDHFLSDEEWLGSDFRGRILFDLWKAIKETV